MFEVIKNEPKIISVPEEGTLGLAEGAALAKAEIIPVLKGVVRGPQQLHLVIPAERPIFTVDDVRTISSHFFIGLFQDLLIALRDEHFPELKHQPAVGMIAGTGSTAAENGHYAMQLLERAWIAYEPIRDLFWKKYRSPFLMQTNVQP